MMRRPLTCETDDRWIRYETLNARRERGGRTPVFACVYSLLASACFVDPPTPRLIHVSRVEKLQTRAIIKSVRCPRASLVVPNL